MRVRLYRRRAVARAIALKLRTRASEDRQGGGVRVTSSTMQQLQVSNDIPSSECLAALLRERSTCCGRELFAAYGIPLSPAECQGTVPKLAFFTIAGFAGAHFGGSVVLGVDEAILRRSNKTTSGAADWIAELGNQFVGRIKNRLLREGICISRVPLAVISAQALGMVCARPGTEMVRLADDNDAVWIWVDCEATRLEEADAVPLEERNALGEGEMLLF